MLENIAGIDIFYEMLGEGRPLLLLHGNGEDHTILAKTAQKLADAGFQAYLPDTRCHGQSGRVDELNYRDMAEDVAGLIQRLNLQRPGIIGFSDGGITGLILAINYPDMLSALICCGANAHPSGLKRWFRWMTHIGYTFSRDDKLRLMLRQPDISDAELAAISCPTLMMAGEKDIIYDAHTRHIQGCIPLSRLCILSGQTHDSYIKNEDILLEHALPFLREHI